MKRVVRVSAFEFSTACPSYNYISGTNNFGVKCTVMSENRGLLWDKYTLKLEGSDENIQMFLDYLKCEGFKIKYP